MATPPLNKIERAHQMYRDGKYEEALAFYTEALTMAKTKAQKIALHSNRAACYLKLQDFKKAAEECTSVLELDHKHTGALMLRAQTLVTLREYHSALFDVNRLMELNPSSEVYRNLEARLRTQLSLAPIPESEEESLMAELEEEEEYEEEECEKEKGKPVDVRAGSNQKAESTSTSSDPEEKPVDVRAGSNQKAESASASSDPQVSTSQTQSLKDSPDHHSRAWEAIPKPKGHSNLDYSRWDRVEDDSSEDDEDEDDECQPQYRFRVRTVGVRPVK
ncbi:protein unc-45 homolog A [Macadamia integrifolia]|uniref:protein unc-45 homolog A n=1 Tax=Macadamia integrifolia TaxID=60698 RepID=UPI001C4F2DD1|nr:protein unc-45 homolog A [Macadamia integrifolia]